MRILIGKTHHKHQLGHKHSGNSNLNKLKDMLKNMQIIESHRAGGMKPKRKKIIL